jgi:hypothetical protein
MVFVFETIVQFFFKIQLLVVVSWSVYDAVLHKRAAAQVSSAIVIRSIHVLLLPYNLVVITAIYHYYLRYVSYCPLICFYVTSTVGCSKRFHKWLTNMYVCCF